MSTKQMNADIDIEKDKLEIIKWVTTLEDKSAVERLKLYKESEMDAGADWADDLSKEERIAIEEGLSDIEAGRTKPHSKVKSMYGKWL